MRSILQFFIIGTVALFGFAAVSFSQGSVEPYQVAQRPATVLQASPVRPTVRVRPVRYRSERRLAIADLSGVHSSGANAFDLANGPTTQASSFCQYDSTDEYGTKIYNCFSCNDNESGDIWQTCDVIGFCVEGYDLNSSVCHWYD